MIVESSNERFVWNLVDAEGRVTSWAHQPRLATDDLASLRVSAISGVGVAMLPRELVEADIQAGRLQHLLPGLASTPGLVHAIFPTRRGMVPAVRHERIDALVAGFEGQNRQR
jgi:DNA-binding transcriptional LysR family regulator